MKYVVIKAHRSGYPRPIRVAKGDLLEIGQRYEGNESWLDWYLCTCAGQEPGWIPAQLIERVGVAHGRALEHYSAHELARDGHGVVTQLYDFGRASVGPTRTQPGRGK